MPLIIFVNGRSIAFIRVFPMTRWPQFPTDSLACRQANYNRHLPVVLMLGLYHAVRIANVCLSGRLDEVRQWARPLVRKSAQSGLSQGVIGKIGGSMPTKDE